MVVLAQLSTAACATSSIEEVLIHRDARDVQKRSLPESKSLQISYSVNLKYPATALTDAHFLQLKKLGWSKCSGYREGWDSFVDASKPKGHERSVFQKMSYWSKDSNVADYCDEIRCGRYQGQALSRCTGQHSATGYLA